MAQERSEYRRGQPAPIESNGLGIAAFIIALVGVLSCGLLSPIGLVMSLIAVGKRPRGFAIAGIILGVLGSCMVLISLLFPLFILVGLALAGAGAAAAGIAGAIGSPTIQSQLEMMVISTAIVAYQDEQGELPASLEDVIDGGYLDKQDTGDWDVLHDYWGNAYVYELLDPDADDSGVGFRLFSPGEDTTPGTPDDIPFDAEQWMGFIRSMND